MKVLFTGKKTENIEYRNTARSTEVKLQVRVNVSVTKPNQVKTDSTIFVRQAVMFGSPVDPFYLLVHHMTSYMVTDDSGLEGASEEAQKKIINDTCIPLATEKLNESLAQICKGIGINPVQLPPALAAGPSMDVTQNN